MIDRPRTGEKACLVHVGIRSPVSQGAIGEFSALADSAGAEICAELTVRLGAPGSRFLLGSGKVREIAELVESSGVELILFSAALSPSQERNIEQATRCRVLDRTGLILDIFASRAQSAEGKLQVELAQLRHLSTRLVRGWTHLERQKGGIGLRGPGETQLETDRRLVAVRIRQLRTRLDKVQKRRTMSRRNRRRSSVPTVALVGYTNSGKSTLFNALTNENVYAADQLFATLDPTLRRCSLGRVGECVIADTVGFVHDLPHELIAAFRSTLTETREADVLLHVIDASDPQRDEKEEQVNGILAELGASHVPQIRVFNKIDISGQQSGFDAATDGHAARVWVSAVTGEGTGMLKEALTGHFSKDRVRGRLRLDAAQASLRAGLYEQNGVLAERNDEQGCYELEIDLHRRDFERLCKQQKLDPETVLLSACDEDGGFLQLRAGSTR